MTQDGKRVGLIADAGRAVVTGDFAPTARELQSSHGLVVQSAAGAESLLYPDLNLEDLEAEVEKSIRAIDLLMQRRIREYESERSSLLNQISEEQARVREKEIRLAGQEKEIKRLRSLLATMEVRQSRQEREIDTLEDEFDRMLRQVENRAKIALQEADLRAIEHQRSADLLKQVHEAELQKLCSEAEQAAQKHQKETESLNSELDLLREQIAKMRASPSWRATAPLRIAAKMLLRL